MLACETENINDILEHNIIKRNFITDGTVVMDGLCLYSCVTKFINETGIDRDVAFNVFNEVVHSYLNDFPVSPSVVADQLNRYTESRLIVSEASVRVVLIDIEQGVNTLLAESGLHNYRRGPTIVMHDDVFLRVMRVDINTPIPTIIVSLCEWSPAA